MWSLCLVVGAVKGILRALRGADVQGAIPGEGLTDYSFRLETSFVPRHGVGTVRRASRPAGRELKDDRGIQ
jgi:hypothetical protein